MNSKLLYPCFLTFTLMIVFIIKNAQGINLSYNSSHLKNSKALLLAQTSETQDNNSDTISDFEEDLESDLEGNLEVDEADIIDEELIDIEREEAKTEEARIEEEFEAQQAEAEAEAEAEEASQLEEAKKQEEAEADLDQIPEEEEPEQFADEDPQDQIQIPEDENANIEEELEQLAEEDAQQEQISEDDELEEEFEQLAEEEEQISEDDELEEEFEQLAEEDAEDENLEEEFEQLAEEDGSPAETLAEDEDLIDIQDGEDPLLAEEQEPQGPLLYITAVDFLHDQSGGSIVIQTTGTPLSPSIRRSEDGTQVIIELDNVRLPDRFKRPYVTKEFPSNIGFFQAYQENENSKARFVVQVREPIEPNVRIEGNSILIEAQGSSFATQDPGLDKQPVLTPIEEPPVQEPLDMGESMAVTSPVLGQPLEAPSSEDFLLKNTKFTGKPISIEVNKADIRDVLDFITNESGLNIIFSESVKGSVTLKLREIPWDQAFILVLQMKKLGYVKNGDILIVDTISAIQSEIKERQALLDSKKNLQPLKIQILPINYAKAQDMISKIQVFKSQRGQIQADPRTNSLIITDINENIQRMRSLIRNLDVQIPQVLIEGQIIEANETFNRQFGLAVEGRNLNATIKSFNLDHASGGGELFNLDLRQIVGLNAGTLSAIFGMLESQQVLKVLSSPRIITLNNMGASIQQSTQIPIAKAESSGGGVTASTEYKDITFSLNVTPQVTSGESIILQINIQRQAQGGGTAKGEAPIVSGRSANTNIMVNDGDTAVIGGIYETTTNKSHSGVPILKSIPLIGSLFRTNSYSTNKTELLIFLTPRVLNRNETFALSRSEDDGINEEDLNEVELDLEEEFETF